MIFSALKKRPKILTRGGEISLNSTHKKSNQRIPKSAIRHKICPARRAIKCGFVLQLIFMFLRHKTNHTTGTILARAVQFGVLQQQLQKNE